MLIHLTGRHIEFTPALREHVEGKLSKLGRLLGDGAEAFAILSVEKHRHLAEIQLKTRSAVFAGQEETADLYVSIDEVVDKLERQVRRAKDKRTARRRQAVKTGEAVAALVEADSSSLERRRPAKPAPARRPRSRAADTGPAPRIVKVRSYRLKPLSPEDAVLELEGSGRDVLVFRDPETGRLGVLYRMKDGAYGHIDAKL